MLQSVSARQRAEQKLSSAPPSGVMKEGTAKGLGSFLDHRMIHQEKGTQKILKSDKMFVVIP